MLDKELFKKEIKANCICWYDFKLNSKVLIIGEDVSELEDYLLSKKCDVKVTKESLLPNNKFDYIIIKDNLKCLSKTKNILNKNGVILLLLNNRFGLANVSKNNKEQYTKQEIEQYLKKLKFNSYKFFYPLSNYEQANTIFSEDCLPKYNNSKLLNNVFYDDETIIKYNEIEAIKLVTKAGKFVDYTNSFIVEINNKSDINFISFNNSRKNKYRLITKVYKDKVVKEIANEEALEHINQIKENIDSLEKIGFNMLDTYQDGKIISKFIEGKTLYEEIIDLIYARKTEEAFSIFKNWYKYIESKCSNMKETYIDLVLENTFYKDGEYLFFDQEWKLENAPLDFILYRTINNIYIYNSEIAEIVSKEEFWTLFNIDTDKIEQFKKCEKDLQDNVADMELIRTYDIEYRGKYKNVEPFKFYIKESILNKILNRLK